MMGLDTKAAGGLLMDLFRANPTMAVLTWVSACSDHYLDIEVTAAKGGVADLNIDVDKGVWYVWSWKKRGRVCRGSTTPGWELAAIEALQQACSARDVIGDEGEIEIVPRAGPSLTRRRAER